MQRLINFLLLLLAIAVAAAVSLIDHSLATLCAAGAILPVCILYTFIGSKELRRDRTRMGLIVYCIYMVSALIFSQPFTETTYFMLSDPMRYLEWFMPDRRFYMTTEHLYDCYVTLSDNNAVFNGYFLFWTVMGNSYLGGATPYYLTLAQTVFGILSIITLHRLLARFFDRALAYRYTLVFACCSIFLFYSCVIVRDIIIAFFFLLAVEIVVQPFQWKGMALLCFYVLVVWGLRLYSGIFYTVFPALYLYLYAKQSRFKVLTLAFFFMIALGAAAVLFTSGALEQTTDELEMYSGMTSASGESTGGTVAKLFKLPPGIRHAAVMLYSQMAPFPPLTVFRHDLKSFSELYMCVDVVVYEFFWFFVFYMLALCFVEKKSYRQLPTVDLMLLGIAIVFLLANTSHPDIRRMMPAHPIIYMCYLKTKEQIVDKKWFFSRRRLLFFIYISMMFVYVAIKGV